MEKEHLIAILYKILTTYEGIEDGTWSEGDYIKYLSKIRVLFEGLCRNEICGYIDGLKKIGFSATHEEVRTVVMHCINLVKRGGHE